MATERVQAFDAFQKQLKTLCLKEFPCGIGSWRDYSTDKRGKKKLPSNLQQVDSHFTITLKDYGAVFDKTETLQELVQSKHSPWKLDYSWSDEAQQLRQIAVKSPWLIDERFVHSHFKTLRITDKGVTEVDEQLLKFVNLQELSLNANYLQTVDSRNLPGSLKVLELCANKISSLGELVIAPPELMHLGLGYNKLTVVDDYITGEYWPQLLSLDLSHNNLSDLLDIVRKMQSLPKLRNLILQGNPLALVAGYRGYTIDSIKKLNYLDDIGISADEKHHYKGLARRREYILDEAKVILKVPYIKNVPMPEEIKNPDEQPEYPVITRRYKVQFMFLEDKASNAEIFQIMHDDQYSGSATQRTDPAETGTVGGESLLAPSSSRPEQDEQESNVLSNGSLEKSVNFPGDELLTVEKPQLTTFLEEAEQTTKPDPAGLFLTEAEEEAQASPTVRLSPIVSDGGAWAEEIELNWTKLVVRDDLTALRDFFRDGMEISVIEEKVLSYPPDQIQEGMVSPTGSKSSKEGKKKEKKEDKGKDAKRKKSAKGGKADGKHDDDKKKKKKKGEPEEELYHLPPEVTTLATFHIPLEDFLEGEYEYENVFTHNVSDHDSIPKSPSSTSSKKDPKKDKKKPGSAKKNSKEKEKDPRKSPKADRKENKDKQKGHKGAAPAADEGEEEGPPPPLEVKVKVKLHHWKTAMDSMRDELEEESNQTQ